MIDTPTDQNSNIVHLQAQLKDSQNQIHNLSNQLKQTTNVLR